MNQVIYNRRVRTLSEMRPLNLKAELFERIMGDDHRLDWRTLLRRLDGRLKRLAKRLRE